MPEVQLLLKMQRTVKPMLAHLIQRIKRWPKRLEKRKKLPNNKKLKIRRMRQPQRKSKRRLMTILKKMMRKRRRREEAGKEKARVEARERIEEEEEVEEWEERAEEVRVEAAAELRLTRSTIQILPITSKNPRRSLLLSRMPLRPKPRMLQPTMPRVPFKQMLLLVLSLRPLQSPSRALQPAPPRMQTLLPRRAPPPPRPRLQLSPSNRILPLRRQRTLWLRLPRTPPKPRVLL